jgi:hypothetical protein
MFPDNFRTQHEQELDRPVPNVTSNVRSGQPPQIESFSSPAAPSLKDNRPASSGTTPTSWHAFGAGANDALARMSAAGNTNVPRSVTASFGPSAEFTEAADKAYAGRPAFAMPVRYTPQRIESAPDSSMSDASPEPLTPGAQYAQVVVQRNDAVTGNPRIDRTTERLLAVLADTVQSLGAGSGPIFGIQAHLEFARRVEELNIPGIRDKGVEQSFSLGKVVEYGLEDSIRTDVVLRDRSGTPIAIYDLKTGNAKLTPSRVRQLRAEVGQGNIPVIELRYRSESAVLR